MAEKLRNEVAIMLGETEYTLRATFASLRDIERSLKTNLVPLMAQLGRADVGVEQAAIIIYHGMRGFDDTRLKLEEVGDLVMQAGVAKVMDPLVDFIGLAFQGVSVGKPVTPETETA